MCMRMRVGGLVNPRSYSASLTAEGKVCFFVYFPMSVFSGEHLLNTELIDCVLRIRF